MSIGGEYKVLVDPTLSNSKWVAMQDTFTLGVNLGVAFGYNFTDKLGVSLGLFYSSQGQKYKDYTWVISNELITLHRSVSLDYLKIPLQFNFVSEYNQSYTYYLSAGIYAGFLVNYIDELKLTGRDGSATLIATGDKYSVTTTGNLIANGGNPTLISHPYYTTDFGAVAEVGLQFRLSDKVSLPIGVSYQFGFVNVKNKDSKFTQNAGTSYLYWQNSYNNSPNATIDYRNYLLGIKIGLKFNLLLMPSGEKDKTH